MKFTILKENISKVLPILAKNISTRAQLPILSNFLIQTEEGKIKISSTNLELGLVFLIPAKIEEKGEITVSGRLFTEFISSVSSDKIDFILDKENITLKTKSGRATLSTMSPLDFPPLPQNLTVKDKLPIEKIKGMISRVAFAASNDEGRPVLTGIRTSLVGGVLSMAATDGYRLSLENMKIDGKHENFNLILPAQSLSELVRVSSETRSEDVGILIIKDKNQVMFSLNDAYIFTRVLDGEFPNVEKIIPTGGKTRVVVDKISLLQSVKTASLFARGASNIIKMGFSKKGISLTSSTPQVGDQEDFIEAEVEGEDVVIAYNYRFLLDFLNNFPEDRIVMELNGALNPGIFKGESIKSSFLHIIMPVRLQTSEQV